MLKTKNYFVQTIALTALCSSIMQVRWAN